MWGDFSFMLTCFVYSIGHLDSLFIHMLLDPSFDVHLLSFYYVQSAVLHPKDSCRS